MNQLKMKRELNSIDQISSMLNDYNIELMLSYENFRK